MARLPEPEIRKQILETCVKVAIQSGMRDLSLLGLSKKTKVSSRMLIYHFGSKERLAQEIVGAVQKELRSKLEESLDQHKIKTIPEAILKLWDHGISREMESYFKTFFSLYSGSLLDRKKNAAFINSAINGWINWAKEALQGAAPILSEADFTLLLSVLRGLFLDYWATRDQRRTTLALHLFLQRYRSENL
jgi:AcrR family transcriptional regulator